MTGFLVSSSPYRYNWNFQNTADKTVKWLQLIAIVCRFSRNRNRKWVFQTKIEISVGSIFLFFKISPIFLEPKWINFAFFQFFYDFLMIFDDFKWFSSKNHPKTEKTRNCFTSTWKKSGKIEKNKNFEPTEIFILDHRTHFCGLFPTVYAVSWSH